MGKTEYITNIQKFSIHDGCGIRTNVFFKGCGLSCKWCANPETICRRRELMYYRRKCVGCGKCVGLCPNGALELSENGIVIARDKCCSCGQCVKNCPNTALEVAGSIYSPEEVFNKINEDKVFYQQSGGGVTFSGGEPFLHTDFIRQVAEKCKAEGYSVAAETCGYFCLDHVLTIIHLFDQLLFDIKIIDNEKHIYYCGEPNEKIHHNFDVLIDKVDIIPRVPIIPGINDTPKDIELLCNFLSRYKGRFSAVHILPYHNLGFSKYEALQKPYELIELSAPSKEHMQDIQNRLAACGFRVIIGG